MTAAERKLLAIEIAKEVVGRTEKPMTASEVMKMFKLETSTGLCHKIKKGLPVRKMGGQQLFYLSEINEYIKSEKR